MDLKTCIRDCGLKQTWIARQLDLSDNQFSRMVLGLANVPPDKLTPLARILRVKRADLETILNNGVDQ